MIQRVTSATLVMFGFQRTGNVASLLVSFAYVLRTRHAISVRSDCVTSLKNVIKGVLSEKLLEKKLREIQ